VSVGPPARWDHASGNHPLAVSDPHLLDDLASFVALARRRDEPLAVVVARGEIGMFRSVARDLRASDPVRKLADDAALVICPGTDASGATLVARRIITALGGQGCASFATLGTGDGGEDLLAHAQQALAVLEAQWEPSDPVIGFEELVPETRAEIDQWVELQAGSESAVAIASALLAASDPYTAEHSDDVVVLARTVARRMLLSLPQLKRLEIAAALHDIGKVGLEARVLHKPGPLDQAEWEEMRRHTIIGERIVRTVPALADVAPVIRHAHERFDGSGYPDGLAGHSIPLASRILLACDAYHAMRSRRPYRKAMSHEAAIHELVGGSGSQFDPTVIAALLDVLRRALRAAPRPGDTDAWRLTAIAMANGMRSAS
jgi:hypothetical protein